MYHRIRQWVVSVILCVMVALSSASHAASQNGVGMVTGSLTGTYIRFGNDIAKVSERSKVPVLVKESKGSIDNIKRISSTENAALGIVQSDVLGYLKRTRNPESLRIAENLRMVFPFYKEEVHVLANKSISDFEDLQGKRVVVGSEGSGSWLTSMNLLSMMNVTPAEQLRLEPAEGVMAVLKGQADAMIFVAGKPVKLFKNLEDLSRSDNSEYRSLLDNVHFIPMDDSLMLKEYEHSEITPQDYAFVKESVPTVAVRAVLISYSFANQDNLYTKQRCKQIATIAGAVRRNLAYLRQNGHDKWSEVDLNALPGLWERDKCVANSVFVNSTQEPVSGLEKDLLSTINSRDWSNHAD